MCGIVGIYNFVSSINDESTYINWCNQTMNRRGPDSNGIWKQLENKYITGFVRLAIRDLSPLGNQPMVSDCGNYVISFNGEIYNTDTLKQKLSEFSIQFKSTTDTEVLLYLLKHYSPNEILPILDGIFSFSFYDKLNHKLILARDRVGTKPLYVGSFNDGYIFSSQYDHIVNYAKIRNNKWNAPDIGLYLQLGYFPSGHAPVENTFLFPEGHFAIIQNKKLEFQKYYDFEQRESNRGKQNLDELMNEVISSQLISDVPVGTFLSGGVDSPIISAFANGFKKVDAYTIGVENSNDDESKNATYYANKFKINHHLKFITEDLLIERLQENFEAFTEPFADYSSIPTLMVSEFAKEDVTVVLSGDGPDELLWGYKRNILAVQASEGFRFHKIIRSVLFLCKKFRLIKTTKINRRHLETDNFVQYYFITNFIGGADSLVKKYFKIKPAKPNYLLELEKENPKCNSSEVIRRIEIKFHLPRILLKVDRASMYHSLEVRVPFLSNSFIDYASSQKIEDFVEGIHGKIPLKNWLSEHSNSKLCFENKKGFTIPLKEWIKGALSTKIEEEFNDISLDLLVFFDKTELLKILKEHKEGKSDWSWTIWAVYSFLMWKKIHLNKYHENSFSFK
jgi:asparagine synthase (glutamine-hydrolysing)